MLWDYTQDLFYVKEPTFTLQKITKRTVLSDIARVFDPLNFLGPLTTGAYAGAGGVGKPL